MILNQDGEVAAVYRTTQLFGDELDAFAVGDRIESLQFTAESQNASTTYLQWRATAFGGMQNDGITILERHANGDIVAAAIPRRWVPRCDSRPR